MSDYLEIDFETRCDVDLLKQGIYVYSGSPYADVLMAAYHLGEERGVWLRGQPCPESVRRHVEAGGEVRAVNAQFERLMWWRVLTPKYGWPKPALEAFRCVAVAASAMSLPRSLDRLGAALDLATKKDKGGGKLIKFFSIPVSLNPVVFNEPKDHPEKFQEFIRYCEIDVETEAEADSRLVPLSDAEQAVYHLNERINDRGIRLDVRSAKAALQIIEKAKAKIDAEMTALTSGYVSGVTKVADLGRWVRSQGVEVESLDKDTVDELLIESDDLPPPVRRALELRAEGAKPSVEKIGTMLDRCSADGRIRGVYLHHGAGQTGRFSSRGMQAHNMPKYRKVFEDAAPRLDVLFSAIRMADPETLETLYGPELGRPLHLLSDAVRSFLYAAPGHDLIDADYSSIEGRMAAWFAGETWKLDAFRALDAGTGPGMYETFAAKMYGVDVAAVTKKQRQAGKIGELALGYQGGVGALGTMARGAKIKLRELYASLWEVADEETRERANERFEERSEKHDAWAEKLGREGWIAAELIKHSWRDAHPATVQAWHLLEEAAWTAVKAAETQWDDAGNVAPPINGGVVTTLGVAYVVRHGFLWCRLPSGRCLAYGAPRFQETVAPWADPTEPVEKREKKQSLTVMGVDSQTEKWTRFPIYGGSLFNNVVQGSARDLLVNGMFKAEAAGYPIVLHTHDEMAAEVPRGFGSVKEFERIINELPAWADGLPLTASGFRAKRYRKD